MMKDETGKRDAARGYTDEDMAAVSDNPALSDEELASMRPFAEVFPEMAATIRRRGPQKKPTKRLISLRLDHDILERFRADGAGWQKRINDVLRKAIGLS